MNLIKTYTDKMRRRFREYTREIWQLSKLHKLQWTQLLLISIKMQLAVVLVPRPGTASEMAHVVHRGGKKSRRSRVL